MDMLNNSYYFIAPFTLLFISYILVLIGVYISYKVVVFRRLYALVVFIVLALSVFTMSQSLSLFALGIIAVLFISVLIAVFVLYRLPYEVKQIRTRLWRNFRYFTMLLSIALIIELLVMVMDVSSEMQLILLLGVATLWSITMVWAVVRHLHSWTVVSDQANTQDKVPSVTLGIPARNETHALTQNLQKAVAVKYSKLEILVVDDCSYDKTAQIIRSFAHSGVRFIKGSSPSSSWLGKNNAYAAIASDASGEYIVFSGTDIELGEDSIDKLIGYMLDHKLDMVSVMPQYSHNDLPSILLQPLRHFWLVSNFYRKRPPVLSSFWIIKKDTLEKLGSFDGVKNSIIPELYFAKKLHDKNAYRFIVGSKELQIFTRKRISSQLETSIRLLYPQWGASWVVSASLALILFVLFLLPPIALFFVSIPFWLNIGVLCSLLFYTIAYTLVVRRTHPRAWPILVLSVPMKVITEIALVLVSALLYELNEVHWKERNICEPVVNSD